jgi:hypothetical protein
MTSYFEDHGLPLVQLKEQRRDLVVALMGRRKLPKLPRFSRLLQPWKRLSLISTLRPIRFFAESGFDKSLRWRDHY